MISVYKDGVKDALYPKKKGVLTKRCKYITISEPEKFSAKEIKALRLYLQLSVGLFAELMDVSVKTVEAWERGVSSPNGAALRLMTMLKRYPDILIETGTVDITV